MANWTRTARRALLAGTAALALGAGAAQASPYYSLQTTIAIPPSPDNSIGGKFATYDIADIDQSTHLLYLADRSNAAVDIFNTLTRSYVGRIGGSGHLFIGQLADNGVSGPDGVQVANSQVFVGNGDSTLHGFTTGSNAPTSITNTGGVGRVDELAFDPTRNVILAANNADAPPFLTVINASTGAIISKITFDGTGGTPDATAGGLEAPAWDPVTGKYYVSVPQIGTSGPGGVSEIDPTTLKVTKTFDLATVLGAGGVCSPSGLVAGAGGKLLVACGANGAKQTLLLDPATGTFQVIAGVGGEDQVWYDANTNLYFTASRFNPGGPALGIIDGTTGQLLELAPTTPGDHSVAVDSLTGDVFVAFGGVAGNTICPGGCIGVFNVPEPASLPLMLSALLGVVGLVGWRARRE